MHLRIPVAWFAAMAELHWRDCTLFVMLFAIDIQ